MNRGDRSAMFAVAVTAMMAGISLGACSSEPAVVIDPDAYRDEMNRACVRSRESEQLLAAPADAAEVPAFARDVAALLRSESDAFRAIRPPTDFDADHRAFIQNTDDQASRWESLAATSPADTEAFGALQTEILQLSLGRDDLASEIDVPACRRSDP